MSEDLLRIVVRVPIEHAEEARARALELAPGGFEESESDGAFVLLIYTTAEAAEPIEEAFPGAETATVEPGWEDRWRTFHHPARAGGLWIGPRGFGGPTQSLYSASVLRGRFCRSNRCPAAGGRCPLHL